MSDSEEEERIQEALKISLQKTQLTEKEMLDMAMGESMATIYALEVPLDAHRLSQEEIKYLEDEIFQLSLEESQTEKAMFAELEVELRIEHITKMNKAEHKYRKAHAMQKFKLHFCMLNLALSLNH